MLCCSFLRDKSPANKPPLHLPALQVLVRPSSSATAFISSDLFFMTPHGVCPRGTLFPFPDSGLWL